jgi:hypothetical protein
LIARRAAAGRFHLPWEARSHRPRWPLTGSTAKSFLLSGCPVYRPYAICSASVLHQVFGLVGMQADTGAEAAETGAKDQTIVEHEREEREMPAGCERLESCSATSTATAPVPQHLWFRMPARIVSSATVSRPIQSQSLIAVWKEKRGVRKGTPTCKALHNREGSLARNTPAARLCLGSVNSSV